MLNKHSLDPECRTLYGANLQPPAGYTFDGGVATTFSLDFETALAVPVSLALFAAENRDEILRHPLALLEGTERISDRLVVFVQAGLIHAQRHSQPRLCSLFEKIIVEVSAPNGGAFHPKLWAIRYTPARPEDPVRIRVLILSRNLTRDRSWDLAVVLDGAVGKRAHSVNKPLVDLLRRLPESPMPTVPVPKETRALVESIADGLHHTDWELSDPFESVEFAINGFSRKTWRPDQCSRLGVISPFCDEQTLSMLADLAGDGKPVFIGRSDELARISATTLDRFAQVSVMDDAAITEDGEETDDTALQGLHAKAFIAERGWDVALTVGSGNATRPALISGSNVEVFATLIGKRSRVGSVDEILGEQGFGRLTRPFQREEIDTDDGAQRDVEARLDAIRNEICHAGMRLRCEPTEKSGRGESAWRLLLVPPTSLSLEGLGGLRIWPITRGEGHSRDALVPLRTGSPVDLGVMPLVDLSRFLAFELTDAASAKGTLFSTGLAIDGLPAERHAAILRTVINNREAFFHYLRLLLADMGDPFGTVLAKEGSGQGSWNAGHDDMPIFEDLVRSFCQGGEQLGDIDRLINRLDAVEDGATDPVPPEFRSLWNTFRAALDAKSSGHGS